MVGQDHGDCEPGQIVNGGYRFEAVVFDSLGSDDGVENRDDGAVCFEFSKHVDRRRLPVVCDVGLVGDPDGEDLRSVYREPLLIDHRSDPVCRIDRLADVDLFGEVDEPDGEVGFAGSPREELRIERDAVSPDAGSRVEGLESEGFRCCGVDDFPDVDAECVRQLAHLVRKADVDGAIGVLEELRHLRRRSGCDRMNRRNKPFIGCGCDRGGFRCDTPDDLRDINGLHLIAR